MNLPDAMVIGIAGAIFGLDVVSFPQAMLSRPLVACTLGAGFLGAPLAGLLLGTLVEAFALETLPVGASRYPEWGSASVVGGALVAQSPELPNGALMLTTVATLAMGYVGGWSMVRLRQLNARWAHQAQARITAGDRHAVVGLQLAGMTADLARGFLLTVVGIMIVAPIYAWALPRWSIPLPITRGLLIATAGIVAAGAVHKVFHSVSGTRLWFLAGLLVGVGVLLWR